MINYIIRLAVATAVVWFLPQYLKGVSVDSIQTAVIVAVVMSLLNTFVKPVLKLIALPITFLTLGLFSLVITVAIVYACHYLVNGFKVEGFLPPLIFGIILSVVNSIVGMVTK